MKILRWLRHWCGPILIAVLVATTVTLGPPFEGLPRKLGFILLVPLAMMTVLCFAHNPKTCETCRGMTVEEFTYYADRNRFALRLDHFWYTGLGTLSIFAAIGFPFLVPSPWGSFAVRIAMLPVITGFYWTHWVHSCLRSACPQCNRSRRAR